MVAFELYMYTVLWMVDSRLLAADSRAAQGLFLSHVVESMFRTGECKGSEASLAQLPAACTLSWHLPIWVTGNEFEADEPQIEELVLKKQELQAEVLTDQRYSLIRGTSTYTCHVTCAAGPAAATAQPSAESAGRPHRAAWWA